MIKLTLMSFLICWFILLFSLERVERSTRNRSSWTCHNIASFQPLTRDGQQSLCQPSFQKNAGSGILSNNRKLSCMDKPWVVTFCRFQKRFLNFRRKLCISKMAPSYNGFQLHLLCLVMCEEKKGVSAYTYRISFTLDNQKDIAINRGSSSARERDSI